MEPIRVISTNNSLVKQNFSWGSTHTDSELPCSIGHIKARVPCRRTINLSSI